MPAHISDKDTPLAGGEWKKVVVIAACSLRRLVVGGEVERGNRRQPGRKEGPLNLANDLQLPVERLVGPLQFVGKYEVAGGPSEQVAQPHQLGKFFFGEGRRFLPQQDDHIQGNAL